MFSRYLRVSAPEHGLLGLLPRVSLSHFRPHLHSTLSFLFYSITGALFIRVFPQLSPGFFPPGALKRSNSRPPTDEEESDDDDEYEEY